MAKKSIKIPAHIRLNKICELLKNNNEVAVYQMAREFGVSKVTIHRDLRRLENDGHLRRTRGGAQPSEKMEFEFDFAVRRSANQKAKKAIATEALKLIKPGQKLILDTGTTTLELAYKIKEMDDLTIVTPSLAVASVLQFSTGIETVLLGGVIKKGSCDLTGVVTENVLDMFMVDIAFQGADGIASNGEMYNSDIRIARVDQKMRKRAQKICVLCDSSKIGRTKLAANGSLAQVNTLITDNGIEAKYIKAFKKMGTKVIAVKA